MINHASMWLDCKLKKKKVLSSTICQSETAVCQPQPMPWDLGGATCLSKMNGYQPGGRGKKVWLTKTKLKIYISYFNLFGVFEEPVFSVRWKT